MEKRISQKALEALDDICKWLQLSRKEALHLLGSYHLPNKMTLAEIGIDEEALATMTDEQKRKSFEMALERWKKKQRRLQ